MNPRKRRLLDVAYLAISSAAGSAAGWTMSTVTGADPAGSASFGLAVTAFLLAHNPVKRPDKGAATDTDAPAPDEHADVRIVRPARRQRSPRGIRRVLRRPGNTHQRKGRSRGSL